MLFKNSKRALMLVITIMMLAALMTGCMTKNDASLEEKSAPKPEAQTLAKLEKLNRLSEEMHNKAREGDVSGARSLLNQFSEELLTIPFGEISTMEGMKAVSEAVEQAKGSFISVRTTPEQAFAEAVKIRLLGDAITHPNEPMWLQFYPRMKAEQRAMETAYKSQDMKSAQAALNQWETSYLTIRPSIIVTRDPETASKLDSLLKFIKERSEGAPVSYEELLTALKALQDGVDEAFYNKGDQTAYLPVNGGRDPYIWSIGMGSIILTVLTFVAWKMFHSDKRFAKVPRDR